MLKQYFCADEYKRNSADYLCFLLIFCAEYITYFNACGRNYKCHRAYNAAGNKNIHLQKGKGDADCECVYACCNRKRQHGFK